MGLEFVTGTKVPLSLYGRKVVIFSLGMRSIFIYRNEEEMDFKFSLRSYEKYLQSTSMYTAWKKDHPNERELRDVMMEK